HEALDLARIDIPARDDITISAFVDFLERTEISHRSPTFDGIVRICEDFDGAFRSEESELFFAFGQRSEVASRPAAAERTGGHLQDSGVVPAHPCQRDFAGNRNVLSRGVNVPGGHINRMPYRSSSLHIRFSCFL